MKNIFFVSGLPRSGSTLLMNLLGQNPNHHVTPTSGLIELCVGTKNQWKNILEFQAEGYDKVMPRVRTAIKGLLYGFFENEFQSDKVVFDKSRGWLQYIEMIEECLEHKLKILVPFRDIRSIAASFEKLYRNRKLDYIESPAPLYTKQTTVYGRTRVLLSDEGVLGLSINRFRDAIHRGLADRLFLISYNGLVTDPKSSMDKIHSFLNLSPFDYDFNNVIQITNENDLVHGLKLHEIRSVVSVSNVHPWENILPNDLVEEIDSQYKDINSLCLL